MFKKRITWVSGNGRRIPTYCSLAHSKLKRRIYVPTQKDKDDWQSWLVFVKNFYKTNTFSSNSKQISPLFYDKPGDNRPYIRFSVFDRTVTALLDSGANLSIIGELGLNFVNECGLEVDKTANLSVTTADGVNQDVSGSVYIPISLQGTCKLIKMLVVPSLKHSVILGSDFCRAFSLNVNFYDNSWHIQSRNSDISNCVTTDYTSYTSPSLCSLDHLSSDQNTIVTGIIEKFKEINSNSMLGLTNKLEFEIDTGDAKPFKERQYPMSPFMLRHLNTELDEMLKLGVVEPSLSAWNSPVLLVKKKSGEYRFCFDGRRLNSVTKTDAYPLQRVDRILSMLRDAKFISSIDLRKAFWQIPLDSASREKTAFSVAGRGLFHFKVVPFGLKNSAQCQQRLMDAIFGPELEPKVFCYIDDIIVTSSTFEEHIQTLNEVLRRLKAANLTINLEKCEFFKPSLKYLGFIVDGNGLRTDPDKVSCMVNYPRPTTTTEVKRFVGMTSWYRKFISHFSTLISPLNDLIKGKAKRQKISWTDQAESSFIRLKQALVSAPILRSPDFSKPFSIQCDASDTGLGGVLTQEIDGEEVVIAFASRSLSRCERNYAVTEKECLAVIFSIEKFRPYVEGTHFSVITDHYSLLWLQRMKEPSGKLARWAVKLQQFDFTLVHRKGKLNVVPDALSRMSQNNISEITVTDEHKDVFYTSLIDKITKAPDKYPLFQVKNNLIYKYTYNGIPFKSNLKEWKLFVPKALRKSVMFTCHDPPDAGHFGFYKTFNKIKQSYYWPKMRQDILRYVRTCNVCAAQKIPTDGPKGLMGTQKNVRFPFQILAIDIIGPLPRSSHGNSYVLVVADWFTKYSLIHPMRAATAINVVKFVENNVFLTYGVPQFIICDNGTQFAGHHFKNLAAKYKVQKIWYNARYHAQSNFVERTNKTIGSAIRSYVKEHKNWDKHIHEIQYAINSATHEVTGFTPQFLNFARHIPIAGDYYGKVETTDGVELLANDRNEYAQDIKGISDTLKIVRKRLSSAYERNANYYNLRRRDVSYNVGDKIWRRNKVLSDATNKFSAKLAPKYVLCKIAGKVSRLVYRLENLNGTDAGRWHVNDLKPYLGSNSDVSVG